MLIGLHGRAQAGKDTVHERAAYLWGGYRVERRSFADLLYESAAAAIGVKADDLRVWKTDPSVTLMVLDTDGPLKTLSAREYLQRYGTEAHRALMGPDFWVNALDLTNHHNRLVFVTDVRFENEAHAIINAGGRILEVIGPDTGPATHVSEAGIPRHLIARTIYNVVRNDGYQELDRQVADALRHLGDLGGA